MLSILDLKHKWEKEKTAYTKKEVGDGVQKFVKDVLKCAEVFNLKEGLNSTKLENRKNEFKEEEKKKSATHADVVIYINPEIIIPMEIERFQNISAGEKQIIQYQLEWNEHSNRRYGILTDGWTWRFYNNNEYREFILDDIFKKTEIFLEFWQEYIKPEFYYLAFFEKKGQQSLLKEAETLRVEEYRQLFFEDITKLIKSFNNKLNIEGYLKSFDKKERGKKSIELTYAYIIQFVLYKTLVDNEFSKFKKEFGERQQTIFECLKSKQYGKILGVIDGVSQMISKNIYHPFAKEQEFITQKLLDLIHQPKNELHDVSPWLDIFVFIKKYNFANVRNEIFGYIYENYLKALYEDEKKGQYFTDPVVVNFMLEQVGYTSAEITKRLKNEPEENYISLTDPSCGSGTFLYSAVDQIIKAVPNGSEKSSEKIEELINNNVYGLDIEEFPLYLAEMNILMRMLPLIINEKYNNPIDKKLKIFWTKDSIAEFINDKLNNTINDIMVAGGQQKLFDSRALEFEHNSFMREKDDLTEMKTSMRPPRKRFDFVIGNPPYISYNECSKQEVLVVKSIQEKRVQMSNIYGMNLNTVPGRIKAYAPKPNLYAFFIALGLALLKDGGRLCYIIPQTILTAGDLDVLRYHLAKFTTIEKIIIFSGKMFIGRGIKRDKPVATSSLIFVIKRQMPSLAHQVETVYYKDADDDIEICLKNILEDKKISKKKILQSSLLQNLANWNFIKHNKKTSELLEVYKKCESFDIYRMPYYSEKLFNSIFYFDKGLVFPKNKIKDEPDSSKESFNLIKAEKDKYKLLLDNRIIEESNIRLPKGSQGLDVYKKIHKIIWSYANSDKFYYSDKKIMINFNWVLISSDNKQEIIYILSLLNSKISRSVFNALLKSENEKDVLIGIKTIKEFVRVPKITEDNQFIKDEIIKRTEEMLALEEVKLTDLVDFSGVMMQKFDDLVVEGGDLVLMKDKKKFLCKIKKDKNLVKQTIADKFNDNKLKLKDKEIILSDLKEMSVIDFDKQKELKNYIDDLVFALYFNARIDEIGLDKAEKIKKKCAENKFYAIMKK